MQKKFFNLPIAGRMIFLIIVSFSTNVQLISAQITLNITAPGTHKLDQHIYLAGNFNNWNPMDSNYLLLSNEEGLFRVTFTPPHGKLEFKFTKGSWNEVETQANGEDVSNRVLTYDGGPQTHFLTIEGWKDELTSIQNKKSTSASNVLIMREDFFMPQLNRNRKIWIYLPPDYETTQKHYPVLYMHDGQNLFDQSLAFSGEWEVDESLNEVFQNGDSGVIVIGIENGDTHRIDEYTPWQHPKYGGGNGHNYVNFIVKTLKPYIDKVYRTKPDRVNTGIMGSSLGGLISFYAAMKHQDVFGKAGVLSPSFWYSDEVYDWAEREGKVYDMQFYFLGGEMESKTLIDEINAMVTVLKMAGFEQDEIKMVTRSDGKHNEQFWRGEFKDCYLWLFG
ncbi:MAG: alpha/beta hydrolase-fold protein [Bacteroidota bacterium]